MGANGSWAHWEHFPAATKAFFPFAGSGGMFLSAGSAKRAGLTGGPFRETNGANFAAVFAGAVKLRLPRC